MTPHSVLIVEDSLTAATALRFALLEQGVPQVVHVTTLAAAAEHLRAHVCELVILDLLLPDAAGLDGLRALREAAPNVAIVILTGTDDREIAMQAIKEGAQDYLIKGEGGTLLLRTLSYALQRNTTLRTIESMSEQLRETNEQLRRANELKDQFVGMVAHDLRNPLGAIRGMARLLQARAPECLDAKQMELVTRIFRASNNMLRLVDDLLDLASIESGKLRLNLVETDVSELVAAHLVMSRALAAQKDIDLEFVDAAAPIRATVDPLRYEQVLDNLIGNAIKYSPIGTRINVTLEAGEHGFVTAIRDQGQGIATEEQAELFKPFARTSAVPTAGEQSTGLGLAIVRKVVEGHCGSIEVNSKLGEGSTFIVRLPYRHTVDR